MLHFTKIGRNCRVEKPSFWGICLHLQKKSYLCCQILSTIFKDGIPFIVGLSKTSILCGNRGLKMRLHILQRKTQVNLLMPVIVLKEG